MKSPAEGPQLAGERGREGQSPTARDGGARETRDGAAARPPRRIPGAQGKALRGGQELPGSADAARRRLTGYQI